MSLRQHGLTWLSAIAFGLFSGLAQAALPAFDAIVDAASPSVVNISATAKSRPAQIASGDDIQELLRRFYGLEAQPQQPRTRQSFGSGFIISSDGYVLTNNHVIDQADKVTVRLSDRREVEAKVIGTDPRTDIALIKIAATDLPAVKIGDPSKLRVGEWVLAIGSPFGFDYSATAGIVSAKSRALPSEAYVPFIQTDVAINPGNSGGPLFNAAGEVVGINSQIYSRSGGFMGLSFAIPVDVAMEVVGQLRDKGKVSRGYLGVAIQEVTKDLADAYGLAKPAGALISSVEPESPAARAGLKAGDVVTEFDGKPITLSAELPQAIGRAKVGSVYSLGIFRDRKAQQLKVAIEPLPEEETAAGGAKGTTPDLSRLGLRLRDLQEAEKTQLKIAGGVLVVQVADGSGAEAGLAVGDVITQIGSTPVNNGREFVAAVRKLSAGQTVPLTVARRGNSLILALRLEPQDSAR
ncbi:DegQ family serine endoprotease [Amnimonas aquatica]|uniref:Probable periplasmic serine endoprotease DegP-like n=1 Tax=Amnimonas aquatica TaxID=2094561 RepID=A0A2P6AVI6_9GAMM|nr:DegQ family serine endoprotease [Amnimonas aquatica]PQA52346.1 serine peptidase [Amnimonas aquatica]